MSFKYIAFVLDQKSKGIVKTLFPPKYSKYVSEHITVSFGDNSEEALAAAVEHFQITKPCFMLTGHFDDDQGVECFSAEALVPDPHTGQYVNFITKRMDGGRYHLTHSLSNGRKAVESNDVIKNQDFLKMDFGIIVTGELRRMGDL